MIKTEIPGLSLFQSYYNNKCNLSCEWSKYTNTKIYKTTLSIFQEVKTDHSFFHHIRVINVSVHVKTMNENLCYLFPS